MSEPFLERLTRFTPDAGRLDRDALLFAAGRSSARPDRRWIALAASLACSQALTLAFLVPRPASPDARSTSPMAALPAPSPPPEPTASRATANHDLWSARRELLDPVRERPPADSFTLIESGPPLRAFPHPPRS